MPPSVASGQRDRRRIVVAGDGASGARQRRDAGRGTAGSRGLSARAVPPDLILRQEVDAHIGARQLAQGQLTGRVEERAEGRASASTTSPTSACIAVMAPSFPVRVSEHVEIDDDR